MNKKEIIEFLKGDCKRINNEKEKYAKMVYLVWYIINQDKWIILNV